MTTPDVCPECGIAWTQHRARAQAAEAEAERLREALSTIAAGPLPGPHPPSYAAHTLSQAVRLAREALAPDRSSRV